MYLTIRFLLAGLLLLPAAGTAAQDAPTDDAAAYVGSDTCAACHAEATAAWEGSHHALAWTEATPGNILADFDGTGFTLDQMTARFAIDSDGYHVSVTEADGVTTDYPVHSVVGIEPLQQYLLETEPGRLQSFDVVWDTEERRWFHLYPDQDLPPDDGLHWTGPYKTWNARCAECHATGYEKNYDPVTRSYASTQSEIGVGCEACHGPGSAHIGWAETLATSQAAPAPANYGFSADFSDTEATIQQCATCHSRREAHLDGNPVPGTPYHDSYNLAVLRPGLYHADGQILDEVYVYGSFLQSKMYAQGVGCTDCHNAHSAELVTDGNAVCTQCHSPAGNPRFTSLTPADYDSPAHHFHAAGTDAAQCRNCHMVERVYMGNDWRADHSFRIPRPDLATETGAPDACTTCHTDQTPDWAAQEIAARYPDPKNRGPHYGQVLTRGRADPGATSGDLATLAEDLDQSGIVRATALWLAAQAADPAVATRLEPLLDDPDPLVRAGAIQVQRGAPPTERVPRVVARLSDPMKSVRIEAAKQMLDAPLARMPPAIEADFQQAMTDWRTAMSNRMDFPETHLVLGGVALTLRNLPAAEAAFRDVVRLDPQRADAWVMLVRIAAATDGAEAASDVLAEALAAVPDNAILLGFRSELAE